MALRIENPDEWEVDAMMAEEFREYRGDAGSEEGDNPDAIEASAIAPWHPSQRYPNGCEHGRMGRGRILRDGVCDECLASLTRESQRFTTGPAIGDEEVPF
jgi:hypothetical protein